MIDPWDRFPIEREHSTAFLYLESCLYNLEWTYLLETNTEIDWVPILFFIILLRSHSEEWTKQKSEYICFSSSLFSLYKMLKRVGNGIHSGHFLASHTDSVSDRWVKIVICKQHLLACISSFLGPGLSSIVNDETQPKQFNISSQGGVQRIGIVISST